MSDWNDGTTAERMRRLQDRLTNHDFEWLVRDVELKPGGAMDGLVVTLEDYHGALPEKIVTEIYERHLTIDSFGGRTLTVAPEDQAMTREESR